MKLITAILLIFAVQVAAADLAGVELDAKNWYENSYAALWRDARTIDIEQVRKHYINEYRVHLHDGGYQAATNTNEEWLETLKYFGETWVGSDLLSVEINAFNQHTVAIRSEWVNRNNDGTTSSNCANYVAGHTAVAGWRFYDLFIIECSAQDSAT